MRNEEKKRKNWFCVINYGMPEMPGAVFIRVICIEDDRAIVHDRNLGRSHHAKDCLCCTVEYFYVRKNSHGSNIMLYIFMYCLVSRFLAI